MTASSEPAPMTKVLIFGGKTGWIGGMLADVLKKDYGEQSGS